MSRRDARKETYEAITVLEHPMLFTCLRIDRNTVPDGIYMYEVRHDDDQQGLPVQIADWIIVNHWGTILSDMPIALEPNESRNNAYRDIDPEADWNYEGYSITLKEYMDKSPLVGSMPESDVYRNSQKELVVETNMGTMPLVDYREIKAQEHGFGSYKDFYAAGLRLGKGYDLKPDARNEKGKER